MPIYRVIKKGRTDSYLDQKASSFSRHHKAGEWRTRKGVLAAIAKTERADYCDVEYYEQGQLHRMGASNFANPAGR